MNALSHIGPSDTLPTLIARSEALAARLAGLPKRSLAALRCRIELEWITNDLLRMGCRP